ncbi:MAG TPA: aminoacyl-tRNA hydrolase, partial [Deltaproteobacteria bacterium]|nr:aminoacyl-tRNA hydrolase [Deltaproteobacteria bacterium]
VLDKLVGKLGGDISRSKFSGLWGQVIIGDARIYLLKPQTYMNLSGESVGRFLDYFKIKPSEMLIIHDDLDLPLGRIKLARKGGSGGHKGIKSIIAILGTENFCRMKIGIGRPRYGEDVEKFVLSPFYSDEEQALEKILEIAVDGLIMIAEKGIDKAMNVLNAIKMDEEEKKAE